MILNNRQSKKNRMMLLLLAAVMILSVWLGICFGSTDVTLGEALHAVLGGDVTSHAYRIFLYVRLPRVLAAFAAGGALAVSGVIIQGILQNPLAGPNIIGVNSGAGFGAILAMSLMGVGSNFVPMAAFIGALLSSLLIFFLASKTNAGKVTIVLAGVAVSSILSAGIDVIKILYPDIAIDGVGFLIGGFNGVNMERLFPAVYYILSGLIVAQVMARAIDIMGLGDETARSLGMNVKIYRFLLVVCASVLAGAAVSFSGLLGFVGLIVPHVIRRFTGNRHRILIPCAILAGGSFVTLCDLLSRVLFAPYEIPVGIVMSFIGGPFFLFLLVTKKYEMK